MNGHDVSRFVELWKRDRGDLTGTEIAALSRARRILERVGTIAGVDPPVLLDREVLFDVLVYHYRTDSSGCGCGWAELGRSHPAHVIDVYVAEMNARGGG